MKKFLRNFFNFGHVIVIGITAVLISVLWGIASNITFLNPVATAIKEFSLSDLYYDVSWASSSKPEVSEQITIVDVTKLTDRADIAATLDEIRQAKPAVIGVDLMFIDERPGTDGDELLREVADSIPDAVFVNKLTDYVPAQGEFKNLTRSFFKPPVEGYSNFVGSMQSSCIRDLSFTRHCHGHEVRSFALALTESYEKQPWQGDRNNDYLIHYRHLDFRTIAADSVQLYPELLRDRIVILGTTDETDTHLTPLGKMYGAKIQAYATQSLIDHHQITTISTPTLILITFVVSYLTILIQIFFIWFVKRFKGFFPDFLAESKFVLRLVTFGWLAVLAWLGYLVYEGANIYVPMGLVYAFVVFTGEARGIYAAIVNAYGRRHPNSRLARSTYFTGKPSPTVDEASASLPLSEADPFN